MADGFPYDFEKLEALLGRESNDPALALFRAAMPSSPVVAEDMVDDVVDEFEEYLELGFGLCYDSGILHQIALHSGAGDKSYAKYKPELVNGLVFGCTEDDVRRELGHPDFEGGATTGYFGKIPRWIKYKRGKHTIHFQFGEGGIGLQAVTLGLV